MWRLTSISNCAAALFGEISLEVGNSTLVSAGIGFLAGVVAVAVLRSLSRSDKHNSRTAAPDAGSSALEPPTVVVAHEPQLPPAPTPVEESRVPAREYRKAFERAERLNRELKQHLEEADALIDLTPVGIAVAGDALGLNVYLNNALRAMLGLPSGAELRMTPAPTRLRMRFRRGEREVPTAELPLYRCLATGKPIDTEQYELHHSNGEVRTILSCARPLFAESGEVRGCVSVYTDVTEQVKAAAALQESEERFRRAFEDSPIGIYRAAADGRVIMANPAALKMVGCHSAEDFVQRVPDALGAGADGRAGALSRSEFSWQLPSGDVLTIRENVRWVVDGAGRVLYYEGTLEDVSDRCQAEQQLRERESLFHNIIANIPCGVFWKDRNSVYLGCNEQFALDHGFESLDQVVGRRDDDLPYGPDAVRDRVASDQQVIETGIPILNMEEVQARPNGQATVLVSKAPLRNHRGEVIGVLGTHLDVTEQKRLEGQFLQAQKMEAVGRLAGGIAHDFNNLLTVISGNADWIHQLPPGSPAFAERLDDLRDAAGRAAGLVRQLLTFSRRQSSRPEILDLNGVLTGLTGMLRRLLGEKIRVVTDLAAEAVRVRVDRVHLEQVVMNLAVNARDAMPAGGALTLATRLSIRSEELETASHTAQLLVSDAGCGMTDEVKARIFEPFFTTKGPDAGTGLGLATVHGIVHQAGGRIAVDSAPGKGTTFCIELPALASAASPSQCLPASRLVRPASGRGRTILLVEDEDAVRALSRITLESHGYTVREAADAETALSMLSPEHPLDLLVTDMTMPGMDGLELAEAIRAGCRPQLGVIFMSGYLPESEHLDRLPRSTFLPKPFSPSQLLDACGLLVNGVEMAELATA